MNPANSQLRVLCFGAGAIGSYVGGSLALYGNHVIFLETPQVAVDLRQRGLRLEIQGQTSTIPDPLLATSLAEALNLGPFDVALFALKSFDTHSTIEELKSFAELLPPILCLQNGVDNENVLGEVLGAGRVIPGTVTSSIGRRAAGDIILERLRGVGIGAGYFLSERLVQEFNRAGLKAKLYDSPANMKWSKLLTNLPANASSAILDMTPGSIFAHPDLFKLEIQGLREAMSVMDRLNIRVVDLPGTPVRLFGFAIRSLPLWLSRLILQRSIGSGRGGKMPSFHIDLYSGRGRSEVVYLNGAIADYAERQGSHAPVNRFLTDTLIALVQGKLPRSLYSHNPGKFLAAFYQEIGR